jgi:hypothetical protein
MLSECPAPGNEKLPLGPFAMRGDLELRNVYAMSRAVFNCGRTVLCAAFYCYLIEVGFFNMLVLLSCIALF